MPFATDNAANLGNPALHIIVARNQYRTLGRTNLISGQAFGYSFPTADQLVDAIQYLFTAIGLGGPSAKLPLTAMHGGYNGCRRYVHILYSI